jgi:3-keto-5-aminohexanoate cleavage enzyme
VVETVQGRLGDRMAVQLTTEAVGRYTPQEQMALVRALRPPSVSLAVREILPIPAGETEAAGFLAELVHLGISPQYILYSPADVRSFQGLRQRGIIPQRAPFVLFVLGRYLGPGEVTRPADLLEFLVDHDPLCPWAACAFGPTETAALVLAATLGGHVRVGFENNLHQPDGTLAADNAERVAAVAAAIRATGRKIASVEDTSALLADAAA